MGIKTLQLRYRNCINGPNVQSGWLTSKEKDAGQMSSALTYFYVRSRTEGFPRSDWDLLRFCGVKSIMDFCLPPQKLVAVVVQYLTHLVITYRLDVIEGLENYLLEHFNLNSLSLPDRPPPSPIETLPSNISLSACRWWKLNCFGGLKKRYCRRSSSRS